MAMPLTEKISAYTRNDTSIPMIEARSAPRSRSNNSSRPTHCEYSQRSALNILGPLP
jgi:hypothetical protein